MAIFGTRNVYDELTKVLNTGFSAYPLKKREETLIRVLRGPEEITTPDVPKGTPAWWEVKKDVIYLDAKTIFGTTVEADIQAILTAVDKREHRHFQSEGPAGTPVAKLYNRLFGFLNHEISHSRNSRWMDDLGKTKVKKVVADIAVFMEEIRVEAKVVGHSPEDGLVVLRNSFAWLLNGLAEQEEMPSNPLSVSKLWALTVGRHKAGIALWEEIEEIDMIARSSLGDSVVDVLHEILDEAVECEDAERRIELAQEWLDLFPGEEDAGDGIPMGCSGAHGNEGEEGEGEGASGSGAGEDGDEEGAGGEDGDMEGPDTKLGPGTGEDADAVEGDGKAGGVGGYDKDAVTMIQDAIKRTTGYVYKKPWVSLDGLVLADPRIEAAAALKRKKGDSYWTRKPPSPDDRINARALARMLENLSLPTITTTKRAELLPPGRLRGRDAVRMVAERKLDLPMQAQPWQAKHRTRTSHKPVIVGCMTDTSGSMSWATQFVGQFSWIVSTAARSISARTAAITFGNTVHVVTEPGATPREVVIRSANDGSEAFDAGAATMDGLLRFTAMPNASKVLFIVSDGYFVGPNEREKCCLWVEKLTAAGTAMIWVAAENEFSQYEKHVKKPGSMQAITVESYRPDLKKLFTDMRGVILKAASH